MVFRRCPQCSATTDDKYGFCLKCGYEYDDKTDNLNENTEICKNCGFENPKEAEFCVKCGMPLIFNQTFENMPAPFIIKFDKSDVDPQENTGKTSRILIVLGYIFSILGGLIGLIIAIYLSTRKDPVARKHGHIQLGILIFYMIIIGISLATGIITPETISNLTSINF